MKQQSEYDKRTHVFHQLLSNLLAHQAQTAVEIIKEIKTVPPEDTDSRCRLIVLASYAWVKDSSLAKEYKRLISNQVLWLIQNDPEHPILYMPFSFGLISNVTEFRDAWLDVVQTTGSAIIFLHASKFFHFRDTRIFLELALKSLNTGTSETQILNYYEHSYLLMTQNPNEETEQFKEELANIRALLDKAQQQK